MTRCLLVGGTGYIGSRLYNELSLRGHAVETVDLEWFGNHVNPDNRVHDCRNLSPEILAWAEAIVLLAGHSSVAMGAGNFDSAFENNVVNFQRLLKSITPDQRLIYASSASVYGASAMLCRESEDVFRPAGAYDITKYMADLIAGESGKNYCGLRFGTVCGYSPLFRTDVIINSMFYSAVTRGYVQVFNKNARRSILGLGDLCEAMHRIISAPKLGSGIFNLASFSATVAQIGDAVSRCLGVPVVEPESGPGFEATPYSFELDLSLIAEQFGFMPRDTLEGILSELAHHREELKPTDRRSVRLYEPTN